MQGVWALRGGIMQRADQYEVTDGLVGPGGVTWRTLPAELMAGVVSLACRWNNATEGEVDRMLERGVEVQWGTSPSGVGRSLIRLKSARPVEPAC